MIPHSIDPWSSQLEALCSALPEAVCLMDRDGMVLHVNPEFERVSGWSQDDAVGATWSRFKQGDARDVPRQWEELWRGNMWSGRTTWVRPDRSTFPAAERLRALRDPDGAITSVVAVVRDVSEDARLEQHLRHTQKLEAVGRLANGVAHDFNNLTTVIFDAARSLQKAVAAAGLDEARDDLQAIEDAAMRAFTLTRQLLAFSRQSSAGTDPQPIDLGEQVRSAQHILERLVGPDVDLQFVLPAGLARVVIDPDEFEQVLVNLACNARDAMPDKGRIVIQAWNIAPGEHGLHGGVLPTPHWSVLLVVRDHGSGMDEQTRARVFEPFYTTKGDGRGSGLGLATVYGIIERAGGTIELDTAPGEGTTFRIYLPAVDEPGGSAGVDGCGDGTNNGSDDDGHATHD